MYIAHIVSHLRTGGAEKLVAEISNLLINNGVKVKIISILKGRGIPYEILNKRKIEVIELNYSNKMNPKIALDIFKHTKDCDIVHTHTYYAQLYSSFFISKRKLITTEHSTNNNRREKLIFKFIDFLMYSKYKNIICISEGTKSSLNKWLKSTTNKSVVVDNGIHIERFLKAKPINFKDNKINPNKFILTCVARFSKVKNHKNLIQAIKLLDDDTILLLVGIGETQDDTKKLVQQYNLEDRIFFLNQRNDVEDILYSSDIFILPSFWEGFGLSAVEALATGTPIIVSNVSGLNNLIDNEDCGQLINPTDPNDICKNINKLRKRIEFDEDLPDKCRKKSMKFDIRKTANEYISLYKKQIDFRKKVGF